MNISNKHMLPKVSVIIPIFKVEKYIEKCARSLFEQTLKEIEFIFVDDCSPDNSVDKLLSVLEEYPNRKEQVRIIHHEVNKGLTNARNTGLEHSTGEFIAHCDSDDWVDSTMYESMYNAAIGNNGDIVYCDFLMVYDNGTSSVYKTANYDVDKTILMRNYIASTWTSVVNMIVKKTLYTDNFLKSPTHVTYCEDYWLSVRLFHKAQKIFKINEPMYCYNRGNENSILHKLDTQSEKEERMVNVETLRYFEDAGCLKLYEKELSWRLLKSTHDSIYHPGRYVEFLSICPSTHRFIWSCPYINIKSKILMWMLTHKLKGVALFLLNLREFINN